MGERARWMVAVAACLVAVGGGYWLGSARADGIPTMETLAYSGELTDAGAAATGSFMIGVSLWSDASSTTATFRECDTVAASTTVTSGHFRRVLDASCVQAVHDNPDLWAEVSVGGTALMPRTHVSAVPYAVEADRVAPVVRGGVSISSGVFCGVSPSPTAGGITFAGVTSGYPAGKRICETACGSASAHMCEASEVGRSVQMEILPRTTSAWYVSALMYPGMASSQSRDCESFTTSDPARSGAVWDGVMNAVSNTSCNSLLPILCCD